MENSEIKEKKIKKPHGILFWMIWFILSGCLLAGCMAVLEVFTTYDMYISPARFRANWNERLMNAYAVRALEDYRDDFDMEELKNTNFQYAVYKDGDTDDMDLSDPASYLVCSLPEEALAGGTDQLFHYSATIGEYTLFNYDTHDIWNCNGWIMSNTSEWDGIVYDGESSVAVTEVSDAIEKVVYIRNSGAAYLISGEYAVPVYLYMGDALEPGLDAFLNAAGDGWKQGGRVYIRSDRAVGEAWVDLSEVELWEAARLRDYTLLDAQLAVNGRLVDWHIDLNDFSFYYSLPVGTVSGAGEDYYLIARVAEPLNTAYDDLFVQGKGLVDLAVNLRYLPIVFGILAGLVLLVSSIMLLRAILRLLLRFCRFCAFQWHENVGLMWRMVLLCGMATLGEFFLLVTVGLQDDGIMVFFWFMQTLILVPLFIAAVLQLNRLARGAARLAKGELDSPVDTRHMLFDFKAIGEDLNTAGAGMEKAVEERMKSERFKTELISNVSHDIKTPLTSIISYVELLKDQPEGEPANAEYLETLQRQSVKLKKLLEDLIEASKASTGNLKSDSQPCCINTVLHQILGEYAEKLSTQEIDLRIRMPEETVTILADTKHLQRVLDNLLTNIAKYAQPGTRAYVNLEATKEEALIELKNTSKEALNLSSEELLERFTRGDSSRGSEGSGLGLAIARSLMELMHGSLDLVVDGDLFKVVLRFPRCEEKTEE